MNQSQTPLKLIFVVVFAIAILAAIGWASLCAGLFVHIYADQAVLTSIITIEGALIGYLGGILTNTRQQTPSAMETTVTSTTTTSTPKLTTDKVQPVIVVNDPKKDDEKIPVVELPTSDQTPET